MSHIKIKHLFFYFIIFSSGITFSAQTLTSPSLNAPSFTAPWGQARSLDIQYKPHKLLYDLSSANPEKLDNILDRVSYLFKLYGSDMFESSIVIIIHGDAIPFFAIDQYAKYKQKMQRAGSLSMGTTIEFRMCKAAAKVLNYSAKDIHGFVQMVSMADAEIVRLQKEQGYAYMQ